MPHIGITRMSACGQSGISQSGFHYFLKTGLRETAEGSWGGWVLCCPQWPLMVLHLPLPGSFNPGVGGFWEWDLYAHHCNFETLCFHFLYELEETQKSMGQ